MMGKRHDKKKDLKEKELQEVELQEALKQDEIVIEGQELENKDLNTEPVAEPVGEGNVSLEGEQEPSENDGNSEPTNDTEPTDKGENENAESDKPAKKLAEEPQGKQKIVRTTAIDKVHIPRTIKSIVKNKDKLNFSLSIQRNNVWTPEQKSLFIHSLIYGYPFPPAYAQEIEGQQGILYMLDGKQRLTTVIEFCEDKFKLSKKTPDVFGEKIANKKFSELPEEFRDEIKDTSFTIYQMRNMTTEERDEMFVRLNKGTPLSKIEQTRAMYSDLIEQIEVISALEFFGDHVLLTNSSKNKFIDQELILQTAMLLEYGYDIKGIGSKQIQDYVKGLKEKGELLPDKIFNKFVEADDYLSVVVTPLGKAEIKNILKKINVPMIIVTGLKAVTNDISPELFGDFLVDFLIRNYSKESNYGKACQSSSAKRENVIIRLDEMDKAFVDFVNKRIDEETIKLNSKVNNADNSKQVG